MDNINIKLSKQLNLMKKYISLKDSKEKKEVLKEIKELNHYLIKKNVILLDDERKKELLKEIEQSKKGINNG
jgi:hypothetical protein